MLPYEKDETRKKQTFESAFDDEHLPLWLLLHHPDPLVVEGGRVPRQHLSIRKLDSANVALEAYPLLVQLVSLGPRMALESPSEIPVNAQAVGNLGHFPLHQGHELYPGLGDAIPHQLGVDKSDGLVDLTHSLCHLLGPLDLAYPCRVHAVSLEVKFQLTCGLTAISGPIVKVKVVSSRQPIFCPA